MKKYYIRWRHIPIEMAFTPLMFISVDHTQVECIDGASEWDLCLAIANEFKLININPSDVRIVSFEKLN